MLFRSAAAGKSVLGAKSLEEVAKLNADSSKTGYEKLVAASNKLNQLGIQVIGEVFAPIKARAEAVAKTLQAPLAA